MDAPSAENTLFEPNAIDHPETDPVLYYSPGVDVVTTRSKGGIERVLVIEGDVRDRERGSARLRAGRRH